MFGIIVLLIATCETKAIRVYGSSLAVSDIHTRSGLKLTPDDLKWTGHSFSLCLRTNLGLMGVQRDGVVSLAKISRWYEKEEPSTLGAFSLLAVVPVPLVSFGDSTIAGTR